MRCDSQASFLAQTFATPCLGREPKAKVVTNLKVTLLTIMFVLTKFKKKLCDQTLYVDDLILAFNVLILLKKTKDNLLNFFGIMQLGEI
jgi:hypothetical protein